MATAFWWLSNSADVLFVTFVFLFSFSEAQVVVTDGWRRRVVTTPTTRSCALYGRENSEDETEEQGMQIRGRRRRRGSWRPRNRAPIAAAARNSGEEN
jgi:hypothetical protein